MKCFIYCILFCLSLGCSTDSSNNANGDLEQRISQLEAENRKLSEAVSEKQNDSNQGNLNSYSFIVLSVEQTVVKDPTEVVDGVRFSDHFKVENGYYVSSVRKTNGLSGDVECQMMDEFQSEYYRGKPSGKVKNRHVYTFPSYEEASREREKYLVN